MLVNTRNLTKWKIRLLEQWQWTDGDSSTGQSIIEEINAIKLV